MTTQTKGAAGPGAPATIPAEIKVRYCLYARKSTESEERQILSIDSQVKEMLQLADKEGLEIVEIRRESHSAKATGQRAVFNEVISDIRLGKFNGLLTWAPDRLARNAGDLGALVDLMDQKALLEIRTYGQRFTDSPNEKFLLMILGSQAKLENDNRGVNVKRGLRTRCEMGLRPGVAPVGYSNEKHADRKCHAIVDTVRAPKFKNFMYQLVAAASPGHTLKVTYSHPDLFIDDLNADGLNEVIVSVIPQPETIPVTDRRAWHDLQRQSKLLILTPTDLAGNSALVAEASVEDLPVMSGTCGLDVAETFDIEHDGRKELLVNACFADAPAYEMLQIDWDGKSISQMQACDVEGNPSGYVEIAGKGGRAGESRFEDLDGDGVDELVTDTRYLNENPLFDGKGSVTVAKWNGNCFARSEELARQLEPASTSTTSASSSGFEVFDLPDSFSPERKVYMNEELGFSLEYPADISMSVASATFLGSLGYDHAVDLRFNHENKYVTNIAFAQTATDKATSTWSYDSSLGSYAFRHWWLKPGTSCPQPFFGNASLPSATTAFGDGGDSWYTHYLLLEPRVLIVQTYDGISIGLYRSLSPEDISRLDRNDEIADRLEEDILRSFALTNDEAQNFVCVPVR